MVSRFHSIRIVVSVQSSTAPRLTPASAANARACYFIFFSKCQSNWKCKYINIYIDWQAAIVYTFLFGYSRALCSYLRHYIYQIMVDLKALEPCQCHEKALALDAIYSLLWPSSWHLNLHIYIISVNDGTTHYIDKILS